MWLVNPKNPGKDKENIPSQITDVKKLADKENNVKLWDM